MPRLARAGATRRFTAGERGQATIEVLGVLPVVLAIAFAACQALAAGAARELADHAAEAGAVALLEDADPGDAARGALPGWARERLHIRVTGAEVHVRLHPPTIVPGLGALLDARARADVGEVR
jgi:hypothetical protein